LQVRTAGTKPFSDIEVVHLVGVWRPAQAKLKQDITFVRLVGGGRRRETKYQEYAGGLQVFFQSDFFVKQPGTQGKFQVVGNFPINLTVNCLLLEGLFGDAASRVEAGSWSGRAVDCGRRQIEKEKVWQVVVKSQQSRAIEAAATVAFAIPIKQSDGPVDDIVATGN